jgi:hypothetical protein
MPIQLGEHGVALFLQGRDENHIHRRGPGHFLRSVGPRAGRRLPINGDVVGVVLRTDDLIALLKGGHAYLLGFGTRILLGSLYTGWPAAASVP